MTRCDTVVISLVVFLVVFQIALNVLVIAVKPPVAKGCIPAPTARML